MARTLYAITMDNACFFFVRLDFRFFVSCAPNHSFGKKIVFMGSYYSSSTARENAVHAMFFWRDAFPMSYRA